MDIFGIGPLEFLLILLVALIIFGPNDMAKAGRTFGQFLRRLVLSDEWRIITRSAREFRHLPDRLMREAGVEDLKDELPNLRRDADLDGLNEDISEWQREVSGWTKDAGDPGEDGIDGEPQPSIAPPSLQSQGTNRPKISSTTSSKPASKPKPPKPAKRAFSWDEPDIEPIED
jgi:hypothetical protein